MLKSWKTTTAGVMMIIGAFCSLYFHEGKATPELIMGAGTAIMGGIGLLLAKDSDVSGRHPL